MGYIFPCLACCCASPYLYIDLQARANRDEEGEGGVQSGVLAPSRSLSLALGQLSLERRGSSSCSKKKIV